MIADKTGNDKLLELASDWETIASTPVTPLADLQQIPGELARIGQPEKCTRVEYLIWRDPWMAVGRDTYAHDLLELCGGENVFADHGDRRYPRVRLEEVVASARDAYSQAGVTDPREEISMAEVHDCFTATELVLMEDLGFSERGQGWKDVKEGRFDLGGAQPVNPDGGLKSFGHPIGASGLRMMYEMWLQLRGEAGERQIDDPRMGLTHNLGGAPGRCVSFVSVVGK